MPPNVDSPDSTDVHVFSANGRGMAVNAAVAAFCCAGTGFLARDATRANFVLLILCAIIMLSFAVISGIFAIGAKWLNVIVNDAGIEDRTRPWRKNVLAWDEISTVSVKGVLGAGHVVTITPEPGSGLKPIELSSRTVLGVPEEVMQAITSHDHFRGRLA